MDLSTFSPSELPRELSGLFLNEDVTGDNRSKLADWLRALPTESENTRRFLVTFLERNPEQFSDFLPLVRDLPDDMVEKLRLILALGNVQDIPPLLEQLTKPSIGEVEFMRTATASMALLVIAGRPDELIQRFTKIVLRRLKAEETFRHAYDLWELLRDGYESSIITLDVLLHIADMDELSRQIRLDALSIARYSGDSRYDDLTVQISYNICVSVEGSIPLPSQRDTHSGLFTRKLQDEAALLLLAIFERARGDTGLRAAEALVALDRLGLLPRQARLRFADLCVLRQGENPAKLEGSIWKVLGRPFR